MSLIDRIAGKIKEADKDSMDPTLVLDDCRAELRLIRAQLEAMRKENVLAARDIAQAIDNLARAFKR